MAKTLLRSGPELDMLLLAFSEDDAGYESDCEGRRNKRLRNQSMIMNETQRKAAVRHRLEGLGLTSLALTPPDGSSRPISPEICRAKGYTSGQTITGKPIGLGLGSPLDYLFLMQPAITSGTYYMSPKADFQLHPSPHTSQQSCHLITPSPKTTQGIRLRPTLLTGQMSPIEALPSPLNSQRLHPFQRNSKLKQDSRLPPASVVRDDRSSRAEAAVGERSSPGNSRQARLQATPRLLPLSPAEAPPSPFDLQGFHGSSQKLDEAISPVLSDPSTVDLAAILVYNGERKSSKAPIGLGLGLPSGHLVRTFGERASRSSATQCGTSLPGLPLGVNSQVASWSVDRQMGDFSPTKSHPQGESLLSWSVCDFRMPLEFPKRHLYVIPESPPSSSPLSNNERHDSSHLDSHDTQLRLDNTSTKEPFLITTGFPSGKELIPIAKLLSSREFHSSGQSPTTVQLRLTTDSGSPSTQDHPSPSTFLTSSLLRGESALQSPFLFHASTFHDSSILSNEHRKTYKPHTAGPLFSTLF